MANSNGTAPQLEVVPTSEKEVVARVSKAELRGLLAIQREIAELQQEQTAMFNEVLEAHGLDSKQPYVVNGLGEVRAARKQAAAEKGSPNDD